MKKLVLALILGLVLFGCATKKQVVTENPVVSEPQQLEQKKPELWLQDTYSGIDPTDPVTFYNEYEINVVAEIPKKVTMFKDGDTYKIDSATVISYVVPALTPGVLVEAKREGGKIKEMIISFDEDENYSFSFFPLSDKSFTLNANKKITFEGRQYQIKAIIKGKGDGFCHLLSNFYSIKNQRTVTGSAGGKNATGTKIIK